MPAMSLPGQNGTAACGTPGDLPEAPVLSPSPVLGLRTSTPNSAAPVLLLFFVWWFLTRIAHLLGDIWQCLETFLVVITEEYTHIQWVKDRDTAQGPTMHMTVLTTKKYQWCWSFTSLPGAPVLSWKRCSQSASPLFPPDPCSEASQGEWPAPPACFTGLQGTHCYLMLYILLFLCVLSSPSLQAKHQRTQLPAHSPGSRRSQRMGDASSLLVTSEYFCSSNCTIQPLR